MGGRLSGKRAMILGVAPNNVGAAIARTYIDHGAQVVIAGRRAEPLQHIADEIGAEWVACDITDEAGLNKAVEDSASKMGGLDIGVNSTGWGLL